MAFWTPRVNRFNDLFAAGGLRALLTLQPPPSKQWTFTPDMLAHFLQFLIDGERVEADRFD